MRQQDLTEKELAFNNRILNAQKVEITKDIAELGKKKAAIEVETLRAHEEMEAANKLKEKAEVQLGVAKDRYRRAYPLLRAEKVERLVAALMTSCAAYSTEPPLEWRSAKLPPAETLFGDTGLICLKRVLQRTELLAELTAVDRDKVKSEVLGAQRTLASMIHSFAEAYRDPKNLTDADVLHEPGFAMDSIAGFFAEPDATISAEQWHLNAEQYLPSRLRPDRRRYIVWRNWVHRFVEEMEPIKKIHFAPNQQINLP